MSKHKDSEDLVRVGSGTVMAALPPAALKNAGITLPPGARLSLHIAANDASGQHRAFGELLAGNVSSGRRRFPCRQSRRELRLGALVKVARHETENFCFLVDSADVSKASRAATASERVKQVA